MTEPLTFPVLPLRDIVVFPHMIVPLFVGREKSVKALEAAMTQGRRILMVTQRDAQLDEPQTRDLYETGTVGTVLQLLKLPDGTVKVLVEGAQRVAIMAYHEDQPWFSADCTPLTMTAQEDREEEALLRSVVAQFEQYIKLNKKIAPEILVTVGQIQEPFKLADTIASHLGLKIAEKQELLETLDFSVYLERIFAAMEAEISVLQVEKKIRNRVRKQMEKTQRDYYLNEQMKAIQKELGDGEDGKDEIGELEKKLNRLRLTKEAKTRALSELKKLRTMGPMSAEATVIRNYLDWIVSLPWKKNTPLKHNLAAAETLLEEQHYGLEKVKERIIEYLAVQQKTRSLKGPILCLVGPPGVGKTSLGKSIAAATGRNFVRMSVGGVRDEAEIRGHRRTYIGSMPGRILQGMKKAKASNPLFLIDEIDKMSHDMRGDPSSALLEVLDPEQNTAFNDHYLEVDYDLSQVMFVCTANTLNMPQPLLDRMEIIRLSGYTEDEKREIARRHLLPKIRKEHGLQDGEWQIDDEALNTVIRYYTREAGVRRLEQELSKIARKVTRALLTKPAMGNVTVVAETVGDYLGVRKYRFGLAEEEDQIGAVTGLAWTEVGGDILTIESVLVPGKGKVTATGNLKEVMKESIQAADSFMRSQSGRFGIDPVIFSSKDIHVHVPEGATPKDGPSAGIAMFTSMVSLLTGIPVRKDIAMTGEITLRGRVLAIGGLKEKLLAALRSGIRTVLIPKDNEKDLVDIPANVREGLEIIPVAHASAVLEHALIRQPVPLAWKEEVATTLPVVESPESGQPMVRH